MAIYRQIHTTYWADDYIGECKPNEKLFYLYLLTNEKTTQCGVYQFSKRYATFELSMSNDEIDRMLKKFSDDHKVVFNPATNEILIINWLKYNNARSPKVAKVIDKELLEVKTREFESEVIKACEKYKYPISTKKPKENSVSIGYGYGIDTISQPEPEPTQNQNQHSTAESVPKNPGNIPSSKPAAAAAKNLVWADVQETYENNFGQISPLTLEDLSKWFDDIGPELVIEAIRRAVNNQSGFRYAEGIMKQWVTRNITTLKDVELDDARHNAGKRQKQRRGQRTAVPTPNDNNSSFNDTDLPI